MTQGMRGPFVQRSAKVQNYTHQIEWPNGEGYTPCTEEAFNVREEIDAMSDGGRIGMDDMNPADYERYNRLIDQQANLQFDNHFGKSERY